MDRPSEPPLATGRKASLENLPIEILLKIFTRPRQLVYLCVCSKSYRSVFEPLLYEVETRFDGNIATQRIYDLRRTAKRRRRPEPAWDWSWRSKNSMADTKGVPAIHWAILRSNYNVFRKCVDVAKSVRWGQQYLEGEASYTWPRKAVFEYNPLQLALRMREQAMVRTLLEAKCSPHVMWNPRQTPSDRFHASCSEAVCGFEERRQGMEFYGSGHHCISTLNMAIEAENFEAVQMLLDHGAEPMGGAGPTAFHWAGKHAKLSILKALTARPEHRHQCVKLLTSTFFYETPLHLVCMRQGLVNELIDHLLSLDPNRKYSILSLNVGRNLDVGPPILRALEALKGCFNATGETVIHLIRHGADITEEMTRKALNSWFYKQRSLENYMRDHFHDPLDFLAGCFEAALPHYPDVVDLHGRSRQALFGFWGEGLEDALTSSEIEENALESHGLKDYRASLSPLLLEQFRWLILVAKYLARQGVPLTRVAKQRVEWAATACGVQLDWDSWCLEQEVKNQDLQAGSRDGCEKSEMVPAGGTETVRQNNRGEGGTQLHGQKMGLRRQIRHIRGLIRS